MSRDAESMSIGLAIGAGVILAFMTARAAWINRRESREAKRKRLARLRRGGSR